MNNPREGATRYDFLSLPGNRTLAPPDPISCPALEGVFLREVFVLCGADPASWALLARALPRFSCVEPPVGQLVNGIDGWKVTSLLRFVIVPGRAPRLLSL